MSYFRALVRYRVRRSASVNTRRGFRTVLLTGRIAVGLIVRVRMSYLRAFVLYRFRRFTAVIARGGFRAVLLAGSVVVRGVTRVNMRNF